MKILVRLKEVYGKRHIYPVCDSAKLFAKIARTKTLTQSTIDDIKSLGYEIEIEPVTI